MADQFGMRAQAPRGWQVAVSRRPGAVAPDPGARKAPPDLADDVTRPVLHACTRAMPPEMRVVRIAIARSASPAKPT